MKNHSWKTTTGAIVGIAVFLCGYFDIPVLGVGDWGDIVGFMIGVGSGVFARDNNKTSEAVGAKQ